MSDETNLKDKKEYELGAMLIDEAVSTEVEAIIKKNGGEMVGAPSVSSMRLAYPLKKHESAFFGVFIFNAYSSAVKNIKDEVDLNVKVLRSLILTPPVKVVPREPRSEHSRIAKKEVASEVVAKPDAVVSNEALEKKLEEILK